MEINKSFYILLSLRDSLNSSLFLSSKKNDGGKLIKRKIKLKKIIFKKSRFKPITLSKNKDNVEKIKLIILSKKKNDFKKFKFINFPQSRDNAIIAIEINIITVVILFISDSLISNNKNLR